ncbi:respiratory nitrate reductase alpha subunit apoprotein [Salana multivorans]|uniref:nitrate reductase (quinone) n=1 Tax=Salana multivorans TaxID=120377 RepID=A0A3N2D9K4_9MICO|nr:nitrate reductase subunit alpha [Salana multivorans]ROR96486.1 respiratory nitrate reductase alpha subunit apoprotein [Salana multivorans]
MTTHEGRTGAPAAGLDNPLIDAMVRVGSRLHPGTVSEDLRSVFLTGGREGDAFYRDRWSHDKIVRSTHGVNCTGSCSWKVYVKDGIITWETQQTDYPSVGPDSPEYEPRGCPRGAAFSWYTYSPTRIRYPYVRGVLLEAYREAKEYLGDPVLAWEAVTTDPETARAYKHARGKGGLVRATWEEAAEIVAAAHVHTIKTYGPDRVAGFSPIPAMSMVSHGSGARFVALLGGTMLSFYDWYADLPVASPQVFGDQTDVPESADWWNSSYLVMWGSNVPVTRTPDAHFMTEARYRGTKVVVVSPDYADNTKFADDWLAPHPGTDGALAMAMGHVILREFLVQERTPYFADYLARFSDAPHLVRLVPREPGAYVPGKFLTAADLPVPGTDRDAAFQTTMLDADGTVVVPNGSLGHRFDPAKAGTWNLELGDLDPCLSIADLATWDGTAVAVDLPRFDLVPGGGSGDISGVRPLDDAAGDARGPAGAAGDADDEELHTGLGGVVRRGVPVFRVGDEYVTTVFDLLLAQYGVGRDVRTGADGATGPLPGTWPTGYDDASTPGTPAWQEEITSVPAAAAARIGREFAQNARDSQGRSMILMGAGTNHWFHSDAIYRTFLALTTMTGCQGRNGGGWAHYVGQEKLRPVTGWAQYAFAADWGRPPRNMIGTAFWYLATDQWRYDGLPADSLASSLATGVFAGRTTADTLVESAKRGWMPSYPTFDRNPLELTRAAREAGVEPADYVVSELEAGRLRYACEAPDAPENFPRVLNIWRANILGSSGKGNEYFLRHLLGTDSSVLAQESGPERRPVSMEWTDEVPRGKLDLLVTSDFRMTSTTLFSDVVLPAATWYEKYDMSTTDMHPYVHSFNAAIDPPWQTRTDFDIYALLSREVSRLARGHLDGTVEDLVAAPLQHDTPDELAYPRGEVRPTQELVPGRTMPKLVVVPRDYTQLHEKWGALGPLTEKLGMVTKSVAYTATPEIEELRRKNGVVESGVAAGQPRLTTPQHVCEMILRLSGTTNGRLAVEGFRDIERKTGTRLADLAEDHAGTRITFADVQARPTPVITSPEWSGSEHGGRRYSAFVINTERSRPWHTLTGRQHFYLDHDWMTELGEGLPVYRPPLDMHRLFGDARVGSRDATGVAGSDGRAEVAVRYLTPHSKWSIHSEYQDNLFMLALSRGGPTIWMSQADAAKIDVKDNDWIESYNRNGVVVARAIVSHRMPEGTVFMYHAKDRTVDVPRSETTGLRGGIHNSLTRVLLKPSHLIGGYAQLSWAFNYLGPTGNQRDEVTTIRRRSQEVTY